MTHRNIVIGLLVLLISSVAFASLWEDQWLEFIPDTQYAIKKGNVRGVLNDINILNTGVGAMVYSYERGGAVCHILLDRTDFENVTKNGLKIEKEQVMGFSCHPK